MPFHPIRNPAVPLMKRTIELARTGAPVARASGAATGVSSSPPMTSGGTADNGSGRTRHAAFYNIDGYNDSNAVYLEDVDL